MQGSQLPCTRLQSHLQALRDLGHLQDPLHAAVQVSGIGKYPFLALERSNLQFGDVLVGEHVEQAVQLLNQGLVPADFCVKPLPSLDSVADDTIKVSPTRSGLLKECLAISCLHDIWGAWYAVQQMHKSLLYSATDSNGYPTSLDHERTDA